MKRLLSILALVVLISSAARAQTIENDLVGLGVESAVAEYLAGVIPLGSTFSNAAWHKWRDAGDTADINVLRVDANDETVLNSDASDSIIFQSGGDANRLLTYYWSADATGSLKFGDAGTTATQIFTISPATPDADDDNTLILAGGGADGGTRGGSITLAGEEVAGGGDITYNAGTGDTHIFKIAGTSEVTLDNDTIAFTGATTSTIASGANLVVNPIADANRKITIGASSDTAHTITFGDGGTTAAQTLLIAGSTSNADDDAILSIAAAGAVSNARGAYIELRGENAASNAGNAIIATSGDLTLYGTQADSHINVYGGGNQDWDFEADGDLANNATNGGNINLSKAGTSLAIQEGTAGAACSGTATANGTTAVTVATTCAKTASRIFISRTSAVAAGVTEPGCWTTNIVNSTSFDLDCNDAAENSTFNWIIFQEAP